MKKNKMFREYLLGIGLRVAYLLLVFQAQHSWAQFGPYVDNIKYQKTESHRIAFPAGTSYNEIHAYDMPSLEYKEMSYRIERSMDDKGNPQTLQTLTGAVNFYEDWQGLAERWLFNEKGTTLYVAEGKGRNKTYHATKLYEQTRKGLEKYLESKDQFHQLGFLPSQIYPDNIKEIFVQNGTPYINTQEGVVIATNDGGEYVIYEEIDDGNSNIGIIKQIKYQEQIDNSVYPDIPNENDPEVIEVIISVFDIDKCGVLLLSSTTEISKEILFNGLCAKSIVETTYSDYQFECEQTALRSSVIEEKVDERMTLSPNPLRSNMLNISLPMSLNNEEVQISLTNLRGQNLRKVYKIVNGKEVQVNLDEMINTQGLYLVNVKSSTYSSTKKIYITKN